jgi:hypothetical protein
MRENGSGPLKKKGKLKRIFPGTNTADNEIIEKGNCGPGDVGARRGDDGVF